MLQNAPKIKIINIVDWHWQQDEYSFLNAPRHCYGLLSVAKGRVDYIVGDKTIALREMIALKNSIHSLRTALRKKRIMVSL